MDDVPIGLVYDHDEEGFTFITRRPLPVGEFVSYAAPDPGAMYGEVDGEMDRKRSGEGEGGGIQVLCRVRGTEPLERFPPEFLMEPGTSPRDISRFMGYDADGAEYYRASASVVGYYDDSRGLNEFVNPKVMPLGGVPVHLAPDHLLGHISKTRRGESGSVDLGTVLGRDARVVLSARDLVSQHLSVIAATGSGKSYTLGVVLEELMSSANRAAALVLDPHGEYHTLTELANIPELAGDGDGDGYRPSVLVLRPEELRIRMRDLNLGDVLTIIDDGTLSEKMRALFIPIYNSLRRAERSGEALFTYDELRTRVDEALEAYPDDESTYQALQWRLRKLEDQIFSTHEHIELTRMFCPGQLTVMDMSGIPERYQQLIATILLRRLFEARKGTVTGQYDESSSGDMYIPYPVFVVVEEAHRFAPQNAEAKSKSQIKTILAEGRKFGVGMCLVSQRPSKLDQDALSQCMTQVTMRIINPTDQGQVRAATEALSRDLLDELPGLAKGQAIVSGMSINTPAMVQVRTRLTTHGGADIDAPLEWRRQWETRRDENAAGGAEQFLDRDPDLGV